MKKKITLLRVIVTSFAMFSIFFSPITPIGFILQAVSNIAKKRYTISLFFIVFCGV